MSSPRRHDGLAVFCLLAVVGLVPAAIGAASYFQLSTGSLGTRAETPTRQEKLRDGTIVFPTGKMGRCRRVLFDNSTGNMKESGVSECPLEEPAPETRLSADRLRSISDAFKR